MTLLGKDILHNYTFVLLVKHNIAYSMYNIL